METYLDRKAEAADMALQLEQKADRADLHAAVASKAAVEDLHKVTRMLDLKANVADMNALLEQVPVPVPRTRVCLGGVCVCVCVHVCVCAANWVCVVQSTWRVNRRCHGLLFSSAVAEFVVGLVGRSPPPLPRCGLSPPRV